MKYAQRSRSPSPFTMHLEWVLKAAKDSPAGCSGTTKSQWGPHRCWNEESLAVLSLSRVTKTKLVVA